MSKKSSVDTVIVHGFYESRFNHFLGRMMTLIETLGLNETQEKAFKDIVKQEIWYMWEHAPFIEFKELEFGESTPR